MGRDYADREMTKYYDANGRLCDEEVASAPWTWTEHRAVCQWCGDAFRASAEAINDSREISGYTGTDAEIVASFDCCLQCAYGVRVEGEKGPSAAQLAEWKEMDARYGRRASAEGNEKD